MTIQSARVQDGHAGAGAASLSRGRGHALNLASTELTQFRGHPTVGASIPATWAGFLYVAVIIDAFSRMVMGWSMTGRVRTELTLDTRSTLRSPRRRPTEGLAHHPNRGTQYSSLAFGRRTRNAAQLQDRSVADSVMSSEGAASEGAPRDHSSTCRSKAACIIRYGSRRQEFLAAFGRCNCLGGLDACGVSRSGLTATSPIGVGAVRMTHRQILRNAIGLLMRRSTGARPTALDGRPPRNSKPVARRGRKATGLYESAGSPNGASINVLGWRALACR